MISFDNLIICYNNRYSWCSERLIQNDFMYFSHLSFNDLIPFESSNKNERKSHKRIVIGHNVGYDRSYIREQYHLDVRNKFCYILNLNLNN